MILAAVAAIAVGQTLAVAADTNPQPIDFTRNVMNAPAPVDGASFGTGPAVETGTAICTTASQTGNANTDCETTSTGPHNETSIAVNPTNQLNMIGGANDYQLTLNPDGHLTETILSRAHVTFDGGKTWSMYPVFSNSSYQATGDPALAFDASGHAYYSTLGFRFVGPGNAQSPDVLVSNSGDGGKTWSVERIASGSGVFTSVGDVLDKEYVTAWGTGNAIVTYGDFRQGQKGSFISSKIFSSVTHDGGQTWSAPLEISGGLAEAFVSTPVVAADGRIFVSFLNTTDLVTGRDDYEVVEVSRATGAALGAPVKVAKTNSDVIMSQSFDRGQTWSAPVAYGRIGDQFMPWSAYDKLGRLCIGFFDRSVDLNNHKYAYSLATENVAGSLSFTSGTVSTVNSDPTTGDRWFARNVNASFLHATAFLGDYSNIAVMPDGSVVAYWTDMRNNATFGGVTRKGEDAYFGTAS